MSDSDRRRIGRPIRVALVDDHQVIADLLRHAFARQADRFELIGSASRIADVPALLRGAPADVVLVDFSLPDGRGSDALRLIRRTWPRARPVLFSGSVDPTVIEEAIAAGAEGVLSKTRGIDEVLTMIERAHRGEVLLDAELLRELIEAPGRLERAASAPKLTTRERTVLETLLANGQIDDSASQLGIAAATFRVHLHRAALKLGAENRLDAVSRALRAGLIRPPEKRAVWDSNPRHED